MFFITVCFCTLDRFHFENRFRSSICSRDKLQHFSIFLPLNVGLVALSLSLSSSYLFVSSTQMLSVFLRIERNFKRKKGNATNETKIKEHLKVVDEKRVTKNIPSENHGKNCNLETQNSLETLPKIESHDSWVSRNGCVYACVKSFKNLFTFELCVWHLSVHLRFLRSHHRWHIYTLTHISISNSHWKALSTYQAKTHASENRKWRKCKRKIHR